MIAVLTLDDGSVRHLVLVSKPSVVGRSHWWIAGVVIAVVVVFILCAVFIGWKHRGFGDKRVPVPTTDPEPNPLE